jgi:hypothetical protein
MPETCNPEGGNLCPNRTEVQEQLFGNLERLHQTTVYITEAGLMRMQNDQNPGLWATQNILCSLGYVKPAAQELPN